VSLRDLEAGIAGSQDFERERERVVKKKKKREIGCLMDHLVQLSDPIRGPKKIINK
jgi:hypothetical protein